MHRELDPVRTMRQSPFMRVVTVRPELIPMSSRSLSLRAFVLLLLLLLIRDLPAQTVSGRLLESGSQSPILLGTVALLDTTMVVVDRVFTDESGTFRLEAPRPGAYFVLADRSGYVRVLDGILDLGEGGAISVDFFLRPQPVLLDSLVVEARRRHVMRNLAAAGFSDRVAGGIGHFLTPEEIERRRPLTTRDLMRGIPRVEIRSPELTGAAIYLRGGPTGSCAPRAWLDGVPVTTVGSTGFVLEDVVDIRDIEAMEIYTGPASVPLQFGGVEGGCGAILIWTRR